MSWIEGIWSQNDLYNEGLPYVTAAGYSVAPNTNNIKFAWAFPSSILINEGLPYIEASGIATSPDMSNVKFTWQQSKTNNFGLPYQSYMENIGAFVNCEDLVTVTIPPDVKYIDYYSFWNTGLSSVTIASDCVYYDTSFPTGCIINFYS